MRVLAWTTASFATIAFLAEISCSSNSTPIIINTNPNGNGGGSASGAAPGTGGVTGTGAGSSVGGTPVVCNKSNAAWNSTDPFGLLNQRGPYTFRNNEWNNGTSGDGDQSIWYAATSCWGVDATHQDLAPAGTVKGYPDMARGWYVGTAGFTNRNHGLDMQVSQLTRAIIRWKMQAPTTGRTWALWDIYFHDTNAPGAGAATVNLMIQQRIVDDTNWFQNNSSSWTRVNLAGIPFRESLGTTGTAGSRNGIRLYVDGVNGAVMGQDDMKIDLKAIIDYYVQQGSIRQTDFLTSIQAGWEIVKGGTYQTLDFWTAVQNEPEGQVF